MRYKHENTIKNIAIMAFILTMILMKVSNISVQMFIGAISCIGCIWGGIYFCYKGAKKGCKTAGIFMLFIALGILFGILGECYDNTIFFALFPACLIIGFLLCYKTIVGFNDKEQINKVKKPFTIAIIALTLLQIVMIVILFIK
jgi:hypothetical protein